MSGWWRAPYAGTPWAGEASAGGSAGRDITGTAAAGAALNGRDGADFSGTQALSSALAISSFFSAGAWSLWVLVEFDALGADPGAGNRYTAPALLDDSGVTFFQIVAHTNGVNAAVVGSGGYYETPDVALAIGAPHLVQVSYDGVNTWLRLDGGTPVTVAATAVSNMTNALRVGRGTGGSIDGRIWEVGLRASATSAAGFDAVKDYVNAFHGLSL
jgi:hypothetical protein